MTIRTGVLSDQHVRMHCSKYLPIPLGKSEAILTDPNRSARPLFGRKLKYTQPPSRPESFDTMAKSMARVTGNPKVVAELEKQYNEELKTASMPNMVYRRQVLRPIGASLLNVATPMVTSATQTDPNGNGYATSDTNGNGSSSTDDGIRLPGDPRRGVFNPDRFRHSLQALREARASLEQYQQAYDTPSEDTVDSGYETGDELTYSHQHPFGINLHLLQFRDERTRGGPSNATVVSGVDGMMYDLS